MKSRGAAAKSEMGAPLPSCLTQLTQTGFGEPVLTVDSRTNPVGAHRTAIEAEAQEGMRRVAGDVEGIRLCLFTILDTLPRPAYEERLEEAETDLATELRATIECVVQDSIEPAIRDLRRAAESRTPAKQGQSPESAARPGVIFRNLPVVLRYLRGSRPRAEVASGAGITPQHLGVLEYRSGRPLPNRTIRLDTLDALLCYYRVDLTRLSELLWEAERGNLDTSFRRTRRSFSKNEAKGRQT
jgi:hypothetical protein